MLPGLTQKLWILPAEGNDLFHEAYKKTEGFPIKNLLIPCSDRRTMCSLWGTKWILIYSVYWLYSCKDLYKTWHVIHITLYGTENW
jgi:hypothetical protein